MKAKSIFLLSAIAVAMMFTSCGDDDDPIDFGKNDEGNEELNSDDHQNNGLLNADYLKNYEQQEKFSLSEVSLSKVNFDESKTYQKVVGFGAMLTPKGWAPSPSADQIDKSFKEFGLNILRLYIYPDKSSWGSDIDIIKQAVKDGGTIIACPWNVPSSMKEVTNEIVWSDGTKTELQKDVDHLKHSSWEDYANHLISYVEYMKKQGVTIYAMSVQNEPDAEFTYWDPKEIMEFTEQYGAKIVQATGVKLMTPEACGMREDYTNAILNSEKAYAATDIIAGHLYQGFSNINNAHNSNYVKNRYNYINSLWDKIKGDKKQWWMTEHLFNEGENSTNQEDWIYLNWDYCLNHLGLEIQDCMKASCSAYVYWYLKRFYGLIYDNDSKGRQGDNAENTYAHNAFIMSQWANYATGKTRIDASCSDKDINLTAYKDNDGNLSFVAINFGSKEKYLSIELDTDEFAAYGQICDKRSQSKQALSKVLPNCFTKRVVLQIPALAIGSTTIVRAQE